MIKQELLGLFSGDIKTSDRVAVFNIPSIKIEDKTEIKVQLKTFLNVEEIYKYPDQIFNLSLDISNINKTFLNIEEINIIPKREIPNYTFNLKLDINNINKTFLNIDY